MRLQTTNSRIQGGVGEHFGALVGLPIGVGAVAALIALLAGGDIVLSALVAGGVAFAVVLAYGVIRVSLRLLPLLIVAAIVLYVLRRFDIGPGFPP